MANKEALKNLMVTYPVDPNIHFFDVQNEQNIDLIKQVLSKVGVDLEVSESYVSLSISPEKYSSMTDRNAGRKLKVAVKSNSEDGSNTICRFSDVIQMMQTMTDHAIADELGLAHATYYRHKKALKESSWYKKMDPSRINDKAYLESIPGNKNF